MFLLLVILGLEIYVAACILIILLFYFIDTWQNPVFLKFTLYLKTYADTGEIIVTLNDDTIDSLCIELSLLICNMNYDTVILILILIAMPIIFKVTSYSASK